MNLISILIGFVALVLALVGLIPLVGIVNWIAIPIALVGLIIGNFADSKSGRNFNLIVLAIAAVRLFLGGGLL
jgi:hypothetical protein